MNRIVLIGNGFDLAHGLKTKYSDLMEYLKKFISKEADFTIGSGKRGRILEYPYYPVIYENKQEECWFVGSQYKDHNQQMAYEFVTHPQCESIYFQSLFTQYNEFGYWSDLESHYYKLLCKHKNSYEDIALINKEFEHLKQLLQGYLISIDDDVEVEPSIHNMLVFDFENRVFNQTYFVTFNYTSTIDKYFYDLLNRLSPGIYPQPPIYIHGKLNDPKNPIIFGYGDKNSDEYKELELIGNNELLKNFKTFQYLRSNTYTQVLGLLESSDEVYVQLIGHSCGLCDKSLLRTIFQHKNVKHIESTYYEDESRYFENLYNISRIFDDNTSMRERVLPLERTRKIG